MYHALLAVLFTYDERGRELAVYVALRVGPGRWTVKYRPLDGIDWAEEETLATSFETAYITRLEGETATAERAAELFPWLASGNAYSGW